MGVLRLSIAFCFVVSTQAQQDSWVTGIERMIASGKLRDARAALDRRKAEQGERPEVLFVEGRILFEEQRYQDALKTLESYIGVDPQSPEAYKLIGLAASRMDRLEVAEPAFKKAVELAPSDYLAHFFLGALYYTRSLFLLARPQLERSVELRPDYMQAWLFLGLTLEEIADEQSTLGAYRRAIELAGAQKSGGELPYLYLGRYLYRLNRFEESLPPLEKAVELNPASSEALLFLGKTLQALKRDKEAIAALQRSKAADPQNPDTHYLLYRMLVAEGRNKEAQDELAQFQKLQRKQGNDPRRRQVSATQ
jgi:tetratricopeptide (TPR) repeat protein